VTLSILPLDNVIQPYAWGSKTAIADLLGRPNPDQRPQAEMWMGTHPKGPSTVVTEGARLPLQQVIERAPAEILGGDTARRFDNRLPYLFKVLAADRPLSIQAHPSKAQAQAGFGRENRAGKALDAPDRNYRDPNHKPEIICALTPFWGLNGFRPAGEAAELLGPVCPPALAGALDDLKASPNDAIRTFFVAMLTLSADQRQRASVQIIERVAPLVDRSPVYRWVRDLARAYPADMGMLSPALLNLVCLDPGQAMYLPAGQLHAYLGGVGIELMANSDNVLRGGLTPKHVDVPELLNVVRFEASVIEMVDARAVRPAEFVYDCPAEEFALSVVRTGAGQRYGSPAVRSAEILLCTAGQGVIEAGGHPSITVGKGDSFLVPAALAPYTIHGKLTIYKAAVPRPAQ
jgi:mannose-6-phosphate isomerase